MNKLNIRAVALTKKTKEDHPNIWPKVARGEYQIVYASPEIILKKRGYFLQKLVRENCVFMDKLVTVAVDEAHLIWDWIGFRPKYQMLGTLRNLLDNVPWVLLSATLSPMVAAYAHEVCNLRIPSVRFINSCRRDNINLTVCPIESTKDYTPLLSVIPRGTRDILNIKKTAIYYDGIDGGQLIADTLRSALPPDLRDKGTEIVQLFFGSVDEKKKREILRDLESGKCRIVICTDAFGLGVDISNIDRVIQWGVDWKLTISSLTQRIGRAARSGRITGQAIIYVVKSILESVTTDWKTGWKPKESDEWVDIDDDADDDSPKVVPVSKLQPLERFGLPVTFETKEKCRLFVSNIYTEAKSVKEAFRAAKLEIKGTVKAKLSAAQKIDPAVLWVLCTVGCHNKAILSIYKDAEIFNDVHKSWCCDNCAKRSLSDPPTDTDAYEQPTIPPTSLRAQLHADKDLLESSVAFLRTDPRSNKIVLLSNRNIATSSALSFGPRRSAVSKLQKATLKAHIQDVRVRLWKHMRYSLVTPEMILPDAPIDLIIQRIRSITSEGSLERVFREAKFDLSSSMLPDDTFKQLLDLINRSLAATVGPETSQTPVSPHRQRQAPRSPGSPHRVRSSPRRFVLRSPLKDWTSRHNRQRSDEAETPTRTGSRSPAGSPRLKQRSFILMRSPQKNIKHKRQRSDVEGSPTRPSRRRRGRNDDDE